MKIIKLLTVITALCITTSVTAGKPPKPDKCPSIPAIITTLEQHKPHADQYGRIVMHEYFDTNARWTMWIDTDSENPLNTAIAIMKSAAFERGPFYTQQNDWGCLYARGDDANANRIFAYSPSDIDRHAG